jgi:hypothetical protein
MTLHVLIPCSKSKISSPEDDLIWPSPEGLVGWEAAWSRASYKTEARDLYAGQTTKKQLQICSDKEDVKCYVISAGGGLIPATGRVIPSYEATFGKGTGPSPEDWPLLPEGGLENINLAKGDTIVTFAPPNYQRVITSDPLFTQYKAQLIVASNSPLSEQAGTVLKVHERSKEVLKSSSRDVSTKLLDIFLEKGEKGIKQIYANCLVLPQAVVRRKVTDEELYKAIASAPDSVKKSISSTVKYIRHECKISAIDTRIKSQLYLHLGKN